ncbi:MAG TPA: hypothetical protein DHW02_21085 [Ktedonobacter sp.]|nr:hypothetical protein [Ktedonobacter sp.]
MPKSARYVLMWSAERGGYVASEEKQSNTLHIQEHDQAWFDWLTSRTSFSFQGRQGHLNLLKEMRPRGDEGYWYAYVRQGKRTIKHYAGRTLDVTFARLEQLAEMMSISTSQTLPVNNVVESLRNEMAPGPLLTSRLRPPSLSPSLIERESLLAALNDGLERKLTLLVAPAGSGKTTLLAQWAACRKRRVAWLSLDEEQNDPCCFLRYLIGSIQQVQSGFGSEILAHFRFSSPTSLTESMVSVLNELIAFSEETTIILDNYHLITNQMIHNALTLFLNSIPSHLHVIIASRSEPALSLARLRASGQTRELGTSALRFTREELERLLVSVLHLHLESEELDELEERIEGWVAGVYLARSAVQGELDIPHLLAACNGTNRHIQTYFLEEVLAYLPQDMQHVVFATAPLEHCNSSLCTFLTGQEHTPSLLEALATVNLFFSSLPEREGWYRYHPLFASALSNYMRRMQPEQIATLHLRASEWFEAHAFPVEAIEHALAAQEYVRAAPLIEEMAPTLISDGKLAILDTWLNALPEDIVRTSPRLCISRIWQELITSRPHTYMLWVEEAEEALHRLEGTLPLPTVATLQCEITALRSMYTISFDDYSSAITTCHQALQQLSADSYYLRGLLLMILGFAYTRSVDVDAAARTLSEANSNIQAVGHALLLPYVTMAQAELYATQGYPFQAAKLYRRVLTQETGQHVCSLFAASNAHIGFGNLLWEWNNLAEARYHLLQAWTLGKRIQHSSVLLQSTWLLAMVTQAQGDSAATQSWVQQWEICSQYVSYDELMEAIAPYRTQFALQENRLEEALFWMREQSQRSINSNSKRSELIDLTQARVLIAAGQAGVEPDAGTRALKLLEPWFAIADQSGRVKVLIEILILQALALQLRHAETEALHVLQRAVMLAEPGRYIRLFVAEGDPMARLLRHLLEQQRIQKASGQTTNIAYLSTLLKAFTQQDTFILPTSLADSQPLFDPLSLREREVLHLIADGRKNREIADELVVVTGTVKAHINMIYQKLGVTNRVQAITRARSLGLLS